MRPSPSAHAEWERPLDAESRRWIDRLDREGPERDAALADLHALLLKATRAEVARRCLAFPDLPGEEHDDLARQSASEALASVREGLGEFRGASRFSTWACKFALIEAGTRVRRRAWEGRELPLEGEGWALIADENLRRGIESDLSSRERQILTLVAVEGVPIDVLAERLGTTRGALYETIHDARGKLRAGLAARQVRTG